MSLFVSSLNSGSNGNCYYVGNESEAILVDIGISCRETERRMKRIRLSVEKIKAIFISHEHTDHIRGVAMFANKYQLPVYITPGTLRHGQINLDAHLIKNFCALESVRIGSLEIIAFQKIHDASEPHSFMVSGNGVNIGVFTDIGTPCQHLIKHFQQCHAAFLEANYDEDLLDSGRYPYFLKNRIRGGKGHLSNRQALELFTSHKPSHMSHLFLAHLSKDNNCPRLVYELFSANADSTKIIVASRFEATPVYQIQSADVVSAVTRPVALSGAHQLQFAFA